MIRRAALALTRAWLTVPAAVAQTPERGGTTPALHWPGYTPPWRSYCELTADNLSKIGITVELKPEEYGTYISTTFRGKFETMAIGPVTPFTEVDDWLYGAHFPEQPNNRSHVADQAHYVYLPDIPQDISHRSYVKGFRPHDGHGMGLRIMYTWLDR